MKNEFGYWFPNLINKFFLCKLQNEIFHKKINSKVRQSYYRDARKSKIPVSKKNQLVSLTLLRLRRTYCDYSLASKLYTT